MLQLYLYASIRSCYLLLFLIYWKNYSDYPVEDFIKKIYNRHQDVPFTLQYLYENLPTSYDWESGYLLIGNDYKYAGIIVSEDEIISPKP